MVRLEELIAEYEEYFMPGGIQQSLSELKQLVNEIGDRKFESMLEVGIADGGTLWLFTQLFGAPGAHVTVVDMDIRALTARVISALEDMGHIFDIHMSQASEVKFQKKFDFLHIDGDHSYEGVKYDFETHSKQVIPGGLIIIHDTLLMDGPIRMRQEIEAMGIDVKTFSGSDTLCSCFGPDRINPEKKCFGMTVIHK